MTITLNGSTGITTPDVNTTTQTVTGGTANGVAYLNGSKVLTTGSALTFESGSLFVKNGGLLNSLSPDGSVQGWLSAANSGQIDIAAYNGAGTAYIAFKAGTASEQMRLTSTGLGIGTSSPLAKLVVSNAGAQGIEFGYSSSISANYLQSINRSGGGDVDMAYFLATTGNHRFYTGSVERMRLDSSGNLGLGVTPSAWSGSYKGNQVGEQVLSGVSGQSLHCFNATYNSGWKYINTGFANYLEVSGGKYMWNIAPSGTAGDAISFTQAMTLDANGNLLVGTTSVQNGIATDPVGISLYGSSALGVGVFVRNSQNPPLYVNNRASSGGLIQFYCNSTQVGSVVSNGSITAYNTTSDYRLKENIQPMQNTLAVVQQLNPVTYTWKADGSDGQGFIAHELQAVVPDCVTGEKDAVDEDGKPVYQGVDTSFLVATLTKAIQEQQELINQLTARVKELENK